LPILEEAKKMPLDEWMVYAHEAAVAHLSGLPVVEKKEDGAKPSLTGTDLAAFNKGKDIFLKEGYCGTCHQPDGKGLAASGFPPLAQSKWVTGNEDRLIKVVLNGMLGPIEVNGAKFPGQVPMTPFGGLLNDEEIASVLTYVRNSFGNKAPAVSAAKVKSVRAATAAKKDFYTPEKLLAEHPLEK
jgi:mono/diheme cytochrome c family protein